MAEVLPVFEAGRYVTFTADDNIEAGAPVKLGASDYTVAAATAATDVVIGQVEHDTPKGAVVAVRLLGQGVARYKTTTPVTVGKFVAPTTGGVAAVTAGPVIGLVIAASTAADPWVHVLNGINLK